jgi:hypothetical protein
MWYEQKNMWNQQKNCEYDIKILQLALYSHNQ